MIHLAKTIQLNFSYLSVATKMAKHFFATLLCMLFTVNSFATDYYQRQSGNWNSALTWTTSSAWNGTANTGTYPQAGDNVHFKNNGNTATVTLTADVQCANLYFDGSDPANVIAMGNYNLTVTGTWTTNWGSNTTFTQGSGYLQINGSIPMFLEAKTIKNFRVGSSSFSFTQNNTTTLTVTSNYDFNCFQSAIPTGIVASGATKRNATPCNPVLTATSLTSFGSVCLNSTLGTYSFTLSGMALINTPVTVGALTGFSYSTSANGTYTSTLSLTQSGGNYSQVIYVKFTPVYAATYNGNIVVSGGGASNVNVAAVGSGAATVAPTVGLPTATNITSSTASLGGTITVDGCSSQNITERGIYYSTTSGFANGTGTKVSETGVFGMGEFSVNVTGLSASTTYYYKAFATNSSGTAYSTQGTFNNIPRTYYSRQTGDWTDLQTWSTVSGTSSINDGTYPQAGDNVVISQPNVVTVNTTGLSCNNLNMIAYGTRLILSNDFTINGNLDVANQSYVTAGSYNLTIKGNFSNTASDYHSRIEYSSGNITIGGNVSVSKGGIEPFNCTGTGWLIVNGTSKTFTVSSDIVVPRFSQPSTAFTKAGASAFTVSTVFDRNCGPAPTVSGGIFTVSGSTINANCNPTKLYRSNVATGNWSDAATWQQSTDNGSTWATATAAPIVTDGAVTIRTGHTITLTGAAGASSLTINGTLNLSTYTLSGSGSLTLASSAALLVGGASNFPTGFGTVTLNTGSTVTYNNAGNQVVSPRIYDNLTLSGSGAKTTTGVTVNGIFSLEGTATTTSSIVTNATSTTLQFKGTTALTITDNMFQGNKSFNMIIANSQGVTLNSDFTINNNLTINAATSLTIQPALKLAVAGTVTNSAGVSGIVIKANSTQPNGTFIFYNAQSNPVSGTVEMYSKAFKSSTADAYNNYYKWQFFGIPTSTVAASPTFNGSYVRSFLESGDETSHWVNLTSGSVLNAFNGYEITQTTPTIITFQGQLVNWDWTSPQLTKTIGAPYSGQHVLANPFTSAIDIKNIVFGSDMEQTVYLYSTGSYGDWAVSTGTSTDAGQWAVSTPGTAGTLGIPSQIPSMQAVLVKVINASANATVTFPYSSALKNTELQRLPGTKTAASPSEKYLSNKICLRVDVIGSKKADKIWLLVDSTYTKKYDNGCDGIKVKGDASSPQLYAVEPDNDYQIDCVADLNNTVLGFKPGEDKAYTLTFTTSNIEKKYARLYLLDLATGKVIDITEDATSYTFEPVGTIQNRFKIVTRLPEPDSKDSDSAKLHLFSSDNIIYVENLTDQQGEFSVYDLVGHCLKKLSFGANEIKAIQRDFLTGGAYVLHATVPTERASKVLVLD